MSAITHDISHSKLLHVYGNHRATQF